MDYGIGARAGLAKLVNYESSMRLGFKLVFLLTALAAAVAGGVAAAAQGLWGERAGLGLKPSHDAPALTAGLAFGGEPPYTLQARRSLDQVLYGGVRDLPRPGLQSAESYSGVFYPLSESWSSSLEAGVAQESWPAPRRYSLSGQVYAAFGDGRGLSVGLKYRIYEPGSSVPLALAGDPAWTAGGTHAFGFGRVPGTGLGPSYQLQLSYQHSAASTFGLALGRDLETFTPGFDVPGNGGRQLTFTGQHWLTPSWALSYDVLSNDPGNPFRALGLRLGVRYRF